MIDPGTTQGCGGKSRVRAAALVPALLLLSLLVAGSAAALEPGRRLDQYGHTAWPTVAHAASIHSLVPTGRGQIWVATSEGLVRLDGPRVTAFDGQRLPGMVERDVRALAQTRDGALWIGAAGRGLARLSGTTLGPWQAGPVPGREIYDLIETPDGTMWAGGKSGVARFSAGQDPGKGAAAGSASGGLPHQCTHVFAYDSAHQILWAGTHAGLARWQGSGWVAEPDPAGVAGVAGVAIDALLAEPDGTLWVGTRGAGLWQRQGDSWRHFGTDAGLGADQIAALLRDRAGHLWVATHAGSPQQLGGLAWRQGERFVTFPLPPKLCPDRIEALAEDDEGGLWLGTEQCGLHRLSDRPLQSLTTLDGLPSDRVLGLAALPHPEGGGGETVLIGTRGGGTAIRRAGQIQGLACAAGLPCDECWDFSARVPGEFLAVCRGNAVLRGAADERALTLLEPLPAGWSQASFALHTRDGALWMAHDKQVIRSQAGEVAPVRGQEGLEGARTLFEDAGGDVWIGADDGLGRWHGGQLQLWRLPQGDHPAEIANFHQDAAGTLWMATKGEGIRRLGAPAAGAAAARIQTIGVNQGLPANWIIQLLEDGQGRLWASSSKGIFWVPRRELDEIAAGRRARVTPSLYDGNDGVILRTESFGHPAGFKDGQGRLWFASNGGVVIVDPASPAWRGGAPPVTIDQVQIGGQAVADAATVIMAGGARDLEASFSARSFAPEGDLLFRYRLGPVDPGEGTARADWIDLGNARSLRHARLGPGGYQLAIEARTREGDFQGRPAQLVFTLRPPFQRSPGFFLLLVAAAGLLLLGLHRLRIRRTRADLNALMAERSRIAREIHDTLAQAFVATSVQLECLEEALEADPRAQDGASGAKIRRHLGTAKQVVEESLDEARRALWVLRPQAVESGLVPALETLVKRVSGATAVDLSVAGVARELSPLVASNLLRIAQEAVANAHRHGRARRIALRLAFSPTSVTLTVADDGQGIDPRAGAGTDGQESMGMGILGMGILGMKERAAQIGGTFSIEAAPARPGAPGQGTCVRVEVAA